MQLVELSEQGAVPFETLRTGSGYRRVRFLAAHVPPVGFRVYGLKAGGRREESPAEDLPATDTIENSFYRVRFRPEGGGVAGIFDKQLGRELVDPASPYLANQFLYVSGGDDSRIVFARGVLPLATLTVSTVSGGKVVRVRKTPWGRELLYTASARQAPSIETEILLFDNEKKIEFINRLWKEPSDNKEAVYFAFPFAMEKPEFRYEGQVGSVDPARDELAGGCREWYAVGHWARVQGSDASAALVPVDAPLVTFGDINRGLWPRDFSPNRRLSSRTR